MLGARRGSWWSVAAHVAALSLWFLVLVLPLLGQDAGCAGLLSEPQLIKLLSAHADDATVQSLVTKCGVGFTSDAAVRARLQAAGASDALLAVLAVLGPPVVPPPADRRATGNGSPAPLPLPSPTVTGVPHASGKAEVGSFPTARGTLSTSADGVHYASKDGKDSFNCAASTISLVLQTGNTLNVYCQADHLFDVVDNATADAIKDAVSSVMDAAGSFRGVTMVRVPASHQHGLVGWCDGTLVLTATTIQFTSTSHPEHSFEWPTTGTWAFADPAQGGFDLRHLTVRRMGEKNKAFMIAYEHSQESFPNAFTATALSVLWGKPSARSNLGWTWKALP